MREIKFRGLYCGEDGIKEWEYGYLGRCGNDFVIEDEQGLGTFIDENTIGQYIGMKDKNSKEIYEGDIIEYKCIFGNFITTELGIVIYSNGTFLIDPIKPTYFNSKLMFNSETLKVIGNIYENPELL